MSIGRFFVKSLDDLIVPYPSLSVLLVTMRINHVNSFIQDRLQRNAAVLVIISVLIETNGFYVPGVAPVEFKKGQKIDVKAVKMTSIHTQLPYEYYSLPFCRPKKGTFIYKSENLGEILRGDRYNSIMSSFIREYRY